MAEITPGTQFIGMAPGLDLKERRSASNNSKTEVYTIEDIAAAAGGGAIEGTQYVFVQANGTDVENATELQAAYDLAKTMSPSADNRITVVAAPGTYKFPSTFVMDTEFIDLVSLTGNRDVIFDIDVVDPFQYDPITFDITSIGEGLLIDTDNVFVKGIKGKLRQSTNCNNFFGLGEDYVLPIQIADNLPNIVIENCEGGPFSFGGDFTFRNNPINASGTFTNCIGDSGSFGGDGGTASGTFTNCIGDSDSFGGYGGTASGTFTNCIGADESFGGYGTASGTFTNCEGGEDSFGGDGGTASGTFTNCIGDSGSFGGDGGTASGTFTNCEGGEDSFGGSGTLSGKLYYCRLTAGSFVTVSGGGITRLCIDGNNAINTQN
jgi:hypothetical protein